MLTSQQVESTNYYNLPSSSLATIKFTKSMERAAIYVGLNAVSTVFNNNDLRKDMYVSAKLLKIIKDVYCSNMFTHSPVFYIELGFLREDSRAMLPPKLVRSNLKPANKDSDRIVE